jgi:NDP-sugar pyrophosphorylase family protein
MKAVIMVGGKGTRLAPFTRVLPKPLIPLGDYPILEINICQLRAAGFTDITLTLGYLPHLFKAYFGDGERLGVKISYSYEEQPLGTAGPLTLIEGLDEPFLLMNGDLLTDLNFADLYDYHLARNAAVTMALHPKEVNIDFGVIEVDAESRILGSLEKPRFTYLINMGIYVVSPQAVKLIPYNQFYSFMDLVDDLRARGDPVYGYQFEGVWMDLGRVDDFTTAAEKYDYLTCPTEEAYKIEQRRREVVLEKIGVL